MTSKTNKTFEVKRNGRGSPCKAPPSSKTKPAMTKEQPSTLLMKMITK